VMQDSLHSGIGSPSMTGLSPARSVRLRLAHMQQRRSNKVRRKYLFGSQQDYVSPPHSRNERFISQ